tara:strand:- start:132 stop:2471 length:2340 start_codon:yes stop_codon:yes gene_type:complete
MASLIGKGAAKLAKVIKKELEDTEFFGLRPEPGASSDDIPLEKFTPAKEAVDKVGRKKFVRKGTGLSKTEKDAIKKAENLTKQLRTLINKSENPDLTETQLKGLRTDYSKIKKKIDNLLEDDAGEVLREGIPVIERGGRRMAAFPPKAHADSPPMNREEYARNAKFKEWISGDEELNRIKRRDEVVKGIVDQGKAIVRRNETIQKELEKLTKFTGPAARRTTRSGPSGRAVTSTSSKDPSLTKEINQLQKEHKNNLRQLTKLRNQYKGYTTPRKKRKGFETKGRDVSEKKLETQVKAEERVSLGDVESLARGRSGREQLGRRGLWKPRQQKALEREVNNFLENYGTITEVPEGRTTTAGAPDDSEMKDSLIGIQEALGTASLPKGTRVSPGIQQKIPRTLKDIRGQVHASRATVAQINEQIRRGKGVPARSYSDISAGADDEGTFGSPIAAEAATQLKGLIKKFKKNSPRKYKEVVASLQNASSAVQNHAVRLGVVTRSALKAPPKKGTGISKKTSPPIQTEKPQSLSQLENKVRAAQETLSPRLTKAQRKIIENKIKEMNDEINRRKSKKPRKTSAKKGTGTRKKKARKASTPISTPQGQEKGKTRTYKTRTPKDKRTVKAYEPTKPKVVRRGTKTVSLKEKPVEVKYEKYKSPPTPVGGKAQEQRKEQTIARRKKIKSVFNRINKLTPLIKKDGASKYKTRIANINKDIEALEIQRNERFRSDDLPVFKKKGGKVLKTTAKRKVKTTAKRKVKSMPKRKVRTRAALRGLGGAALRGF